MIAVNEFLLLVMKIRLGPAAPPAGLWRYYSQANPNILVVFLLSDLKIKTLNAHIYVLEFPFFVCEK